MERETERDEEHNVTVRLFLKVNIKMVHTQLKEENCVQNRNWGTTNSQKKGKKESQKYAYSRAQTQIHRDLTLPISPQQETET